MTLTKRQKEVLDFIKAYSKKKGYSPSLEEIQAKFGFASVSTAHFHVAKLKDGGYLDKTGHKARALTPTHGTAEERWLRIFLMGMISAGGPIEAVRNPEPIDIPRSMVAANPSGKYYALKVTGTSMIEEGISDGDIVIVREQESVEDGEKAVAYLPDKDAVTLKKIYRDKGRVKLVPANATMQPFYETNVHIQGKVVGVLRNE
ncbi:MAG: transcriptional repressor LexA [bacterium]|nr:transcriptional repressor LexA [bacterium]